MTDIVQLTAGGKTLSIGNWAKVTGIIYRVIHRRYKSGWTHAQCVGIDPPPPVKHKSGPRCRCNNLTEVIVLQPVVRLVEQIDYEATGLAARRIRKKAGLSIDEACESLGWGSSKLQNMETGCIKWTLDCIEHFNEVAKGWVNGNDNRNTVNDSTGCQRVESV
jgi:hypothetical protein